MNAHQLSVRIYYEDTDFSGNVYHAAYLKFFERGRTEWLRELGVFHTELSEQGLPLRSAIWISTSSNRRGSTTF